MYQFVCAYCCVFHTTPLSFSLSGMSLALRSGSVQENINFGVGVDPDLKRRLKIKFR